LREEKNQELKLKINDLEVSLNRLLKYLKIDQNKKTLVKIAKESLEISYKLFKPKVIFKHCSIAKDKDPNFLINEIKFKNKVLYHNLSDTDICFPYIITLGKDIDPNSSTDYLIYYYTDRIANLFLDIIREKLENHLKCEFNIDKLSKMNPGSIALWPIEENKRIFQILNDDIKETNISLTESSVIKPFKSTSGIFFYKKKPFYSCFLCRHIDCQGRKAQFDQKIYNYYNNL